MENDRSVFMQVSEIMFELETLVYDKYMNFDKKRGIAEVVGTEETRLDIVALYNKLMKVKKDFKELVADVVLNKDKRYDETYVNSVNSLNHAYKSIVHNIRCYCLDIE